MGENDTAALDPIFHFHHCNVDRIFWIWQKKWHQTDDLEIIQGYPGTNSSDSQGSTPGIPPNTWLSLETPLNPFRRIEGKTPVSFTSLDCINIERQLGYTYSLGSLENSDESFSSLPEKNRKIVRISGINKAPIKGSFLVAAYAKIENKNILVGINSVLSRWAVKGCANCQTHLEVKTTFDLENISEDIKKDASFNVVFMLRRQNLIKALIYLPKEKS